MRACQPSEAAVKQQRSGCFPRAEGSIKVGSESVCWGHRWEDCSVYHKWRETALLWSRYRKIVGIFIRHHPLPHTPSPPLTPTSFSWFPPPFLSPAPHSEVIWSYVILYVLAFLVLHEHQNTDVSIISQEACWYIHTLKLRWKLMQQSRFQHAHACDLVAMWESGS